MNGCFVACTMKRIDCVNGPFVLYKVSRVIVKIINTFVQMNSQFHLKYIFETMAQQLQQAKASSLSRIHYHTQTHHTRQDSSGRVTSPTQRPLPDNTQHSQQTDIHAPGGFRTHNPSKRSTARPLGSAKYTISNCNNMTISPPLPTPTRRYYRF